MEEIQKGEGGDGLGTRVKSGSRTGLEYEDDDMIAIKKKRTRRR